MHTRILLFELNWDLVSPILYTKNHAISYRGTLRIWPVFVPLWSGRGRAGKKVTAVTFFRCPTVHTITSSWHIPREPILAYWKGIPNGWTSETFNPTHQWLAAIFAEKQTSWLNVMSPGVICDTSSITLAGNPFILMTWRQWWGGLTSYIRCRYNLKRPHRKNYTQV